MSQTPTIQPPESPVSSPLPSRQPPPPASDVAAALEDTIRRLRAELAAASDKTRQARLLAQIADLEERGSDEPAAARDYLAAYNADSTFREPLEGLVRLLEKRRSLKNLGKLIEALTRAASTPEERVRGLLMRAAYQADVAGDVADAKAMAREATEVEGAPVAEQASAWLSLEVLAGRTGDPAAREEALAQRSKLAGAPAWRALLLVDRARMAAAAGEVDAAVALLEEARALGSATTWIAVSYLEDLTRDTSDTLAPEQARKRAEAHAEALEAMAALVQEAATDDAKATSRGVPRWVRGEARLVDLWLRASEARRVLGQLDRAGATLDLALERVASFEGQEGQLAGAVVASARIRVAEQVGDTALAAQLAEKRLAVEKDGGLAAALALRVAEHAMSQGDATRALEALSRALASDPASLPAWALQLDLLADGGDPSAFAAQLESFADHLATDEARGRAFVLAAFMWAARANDVAGAKAALSQAAMFGVPPSVAGRLARALAAVAGDGAWYEEATKRLISSGGDGDPVSLYVELLRARMARNDEEGALKAVRDMAGTPKGTWLARVLEAYLFSPPNPRSDRGDPEETLTKATSRGTAALEELAGLENDPDMAAGLSLVAATRALAIGDADTARRRLRELAGRDAADAITSSFLGDLERGADDHAAAARVASDAAAATGDKDLAAALRLEAALELWISGDRKTALEELEASASGAPDAAKMALAWASRGVEPDSPSSRRRAIERAVEHGAGDGRAAALERFALELTGGDPDDAAAALATAEKSRDGDLGTASAIARLAWSGGAADANASRAASVHLARLGPDALRLATAEQFRMARDGEDAEEIVRSARRWFDAGGGLPAALEWLAGSFVLGHPDEEKAARLAVADALPAEAAETMRAGAAMLEARIHPYDPAPLTVGATAASRLANLELSPPGSDPRRRSAALGELDGAFDDEGAVDAASLGGWAALAAGDIDAARAAFERASGARPGDLAAWEGLRSCAEASGDKALRAAAAAELGARCHDADTGAAFWEEAALLYLELGDDAKADHALRAGFDRDAKRPVTFDKLFRRIRERKDNDTLLTVMARRLEETDEPQEIQKLFWEQARVLREKGDQDGALSALEHVTMLDPDHVGALALLGEINIRRGNFEPAAEALGRLAALPAAPPKNRVTAGVAAVDLYENKLQRFDRALEVLLTLHRAKLSSLPVRERLARAAARTGSWKEATAILEELMRERPETEGRIEAARLAMAIHRDRLSQPQAAATAIVKLLEESPIDGEALDMFLVTEHAKPVQTRLLGAARKALLEVLRSKPTDLPALKRLAKVTRALGDDALQQAALGVLLALGAGDAQAEATFAQLAGRKTRRPQTAIGDTTMASILAPGDEGPVAQLFRVIGPTLAEALGPNLQSAGVSRRDKVDPRSGLAVRNEIAAWAGAFGIQEFDLYVGGKDPLAVQGVPGEPHALVVGAGVNAPLAPTTRARVARELLGMQRGTTVTRSRDDVTIAAVVVAACRLGEVAIDSPPYAVLAEVERLLGKAIARKTRKLLPDLCRAVVNARSDPRAWAARALASQDRIAVIASGDPVVVLLDILDTSPEKLAQAIKQSPRAEELLRFVLSPEYLDVRSALGLEGNA